MYYCKRDVFDTFFVVRCSGVLLLDRVPVTCPWTGGIIMPSFSSTCDRTCLSVKLCDAAVTLACSVARQEMAYLGVVRISMIVYRRDVADAGLRPRWDVKKAALKKKGKVVLSPAVRCCYGGCCYGG